MKKTYLQPEAGIVVLHTERFIAASIQVDGNTATIDLNDDEEYDGTFCSRRGRDVWE